MGHTKGPWKREGMTVYAPNNKPIGSAAWCELTDDPSLGERLVDMNANSGRHVSEAVANATLIAAAPRLLNACQSALDLVRDMIAEVAKPEELQIVKRILIDAINTASVD